MAEGGNDSQESLNLSEHPVPDPNTMIAQKKTVKGENRTRQDPSKTNRSFS